MTKEEAKDYLTDSSNFNYEGVPYDLDKYNLAKSIAIEALEKQTAKKPIEEYYAEPIYDGDGCQVDAIFLYKATCPSCDNIICFGEFDKSDFKDIVFCDDCGQAIDLKEDDEE